MIIAIDFDGVIVEDAYPDIGDPLPGVRQIMGLLHRHGHILIINTCRTGKYAKKAIKALEKMGIPYDLFNQNYPERTKKYGLDSRKISADLYIDDKNLGGFPGWLAAYRMME